MLNEDRRRLKLEQARSGESVGRPPSLRVTPVALIYICREAAKAMVQPGAWCTKSMALDSDGKPTDVYVSATSRDGLGWILKVSYDYFEGLKVSRKETGNRISEIIDSQIRIIMRDNTFSLNVVSLSGPAKMATMLTKVADRVAADGFPEMFLYARNISMEPSSKVNSKPQ